MELETISKLSYLDSVYIKNRMDVITTWIYFSDNIHQDQNLLHFKGCCYNNNNDVKMLQYIVVSLWTTSICVRCFCTLLFIISKTPPADLILLICTVIQEAT